MHSLARTLFTAKLLLLNAVSDTYSADHCADNPQAVLGRTTRDGLKSPLLAIKCMWLHGCEPPSTCVHTVGHRLII